MDKTSIQHVAPLHIVFDIDGETCDVSPLQIAEVPAVSRLIEPVFDELLLLGDTGGQDYSLILSMVGRHGEQLIEAVAVCSRKPLEWVRALLFDRFVELLLVCLQVNADFFARAMPALTVLVSRVKQHLASLTGPTPSTS